MKVIIRWMHPISNPKEGNPPWDDKIRKYDGSLTDVRELGKWLTQQVGIEFNYKPGYSRFIKTKCVFFPVRYSGVHCMWIEEVKNVCTQA